MEVELVLYTVTLIFFSAWLSYLSNRLNGGLRLIEDSDAGVEEIGRGLSEVIELLKQLPAWMSEEVKEYIPEFHINQGQGAWLQPILEKFLSNAIGTEPLSTDDGVRDSEGRFIHAPTKEET